MNKTFAKSCTLVRKHATHKSASFCLRGPLAIPYPILTMGA